MTDYTGIARLLSDRPTDAVSLDWLKKAHHAKLTLCTALEEIAYNRGWIDRVKLLDAAQRYGKSPYGEHLKRVAEGRIQYDRSRDAAD